jgi:DNA-binding response OmpR family regulator
MGRFVLLTDRTPQELLPAMRWTADDVKVESLSSERLRHLSALAPSAVIVDGEEAPEVAHSILAAHAAWPPGTPIAVVVSRADIGRFPWEEVADELLFSSMSEPELLTRLRMLVRRTGGGGDAVLRVGPVALNTDSYQVLVEGRVLDLTFPEFELLRFLMQAPGRVFTRSDLLQKVWGYNFYGGTRTVDVHVRRLRAKLGPEHEGLIGTVRGVGYRAQAKPSEEFSVST